MAQQGTFTGEVARAFHQSPRLFWFLSICLAIALMALLGAIIAPVKNSPTQPYLSEQTIDDYARQFVPTPAGLGFCRMLYGKNSLVQDEIVQQQVIIADLPHSLTGKAADSARQFASFQTYCDMAYSQRQMQ